MIPGMNGAPPMPQQQQASLFADLVIHMAGISVSDSPDGKKLVRFLMPNGLAVMIPLDEAGVEALCTQLKGSGLTVARKL
jgi:hypothetical protein